METAILRFFLRSVAQHLAHAIAHGSHPSAIRRLAVWHKDDSVVPLEALQTDSLKLSPVPHSGVRPPVFPRNSSAAGPVNLRVDTDDGRDNCALIVHRSPLSIVRYAHGDPHSGTPNEVEAHRTFSR